MSRVTRDYVSEPPHVRHARLSTKAQELANRRAEEMIRRSEMPNQAFGEIYRRAVMNPHSHHIKEKKQVEEVIEELSEEQKAINKLNPETGYILRTVNGAFNCNFNQLPGCCGVVVAHGIAFGNIANGKKEEFYKEVEEFLQSNFTTILQGSNRERGAIMMSDAIGGENNKQSEGVPCIYDMCTTLGWEQSNGYYNPRSGNYVVTFMKERDVHGMYNSHPIGDKPHVIITKKEEAA